MALRITRARLMQTLALAVLCANALCASPAFAQVSDKDLAALEAKGQAEGWTFTAGRTPATERPLKELCGLVVPQNWQKGAPSKDFAPKDGLPEAFDWRDYGGCPPIRDQNSCGSCWAFGTVGPLECNILLKDDVEVDLSEQWLVSCNQETDPPIVVGKGTWGCNGGWWAHAYHQGTKTDSCGGWGAVLEDNFPYEWDDAPCNCPYVHTYAIDSWAFIGPELGIPDINAMKQAILEYGPISVAVCVDLTFASYKDGVFNYGVLGEPNHAVVLVGWDDTQGAEGVWFLRNSWSAAWGELGYMRIEYGRSMVGFGACYIDYPGAGSASGPTITRHPAGGYAVEGRSYKFTVEATGVGQLHYAWQRDGEPVGEDEPVLRLTRITEEDEGFYTCSVSDFLGVEESDAAELCLYPPGAVPASGVAALCILAAVCVAASIAYLRRAA